MVLEAKRCPAGKSIAFCEHRTEHRVLTSLYINQTLWTFDEMEVRPDVIGGVDSVVPPLQDPRTWVLVDELPARVIKKAPGLTVIAGSPAVVEKGKIEKIPGLDIWYLDIWTWPELCAARHHRRKLGQRLLEEADAVDDFSNENWGDRPVLYHIPSPTPAPTTEEELWWMMWCAFVRFGGVARTILEVLRFKYEAGRRTLCKLMRRQEDLVRKEAAKVYVSKSQDFLP